MAARSCLPFFCTFWACNGGVRHLDGLQIVLGNEAVALRQCMRMRADTLDILELCAGHRRQTVRDFLDVRAVDVQVVVEQEVIDFADRACRRVLDRYDADVGFTVAHRLENLLPGGYVLRFAAREQRTRGQLLIRTRNPLIEHGFRLCKRFCGIERELFRRLTEDFAVLILTARADHALQKGNVLELQLLLHTGGALLNDFRFTVRLVDFIVRLGLGLCDLERPATYAAGTALG